MEKLIIESTPTTPKVSFDPVEGYFEISGKSLPENTYDFFQPIQDWIDKYLTNPAVVTNLIFKLEYFNTSSTSHFLKIIKKMEKLHLAGNTVVVSWYHDLDDEDMKEAGEDFRLLVKLPIDILGIHFNS